MYFSAELSKAPNSVGTFIGQERHDNQTEISGKGAGLYLKYNTAADESIVLKSGFSYTSVENAKINLKKEATNLEFEQARSNAQEVWETELGKIKVSDSSSQNKTKFYTALYHALLGRGLANDVNGYFPENDGTMGRIPLDEDGNPEFSFYNTDSVWGAFWNLTQLWALV